MRISDWSSDVCSSDLVPRSISRACHTPHPTGTTINNHNRTQHHTTHDARRTTHDRSEEHTSELQSLMRISYAVFCLKKKTKKKTDTNKTPEQQKQQKTKIELYNYIEKTNTQK